MFAPFASVSRRFVLSLNILYRRSAASFTSFFFASARDFLLLSLIVVRADWMSAVLISFKVGIEPLVVVSTNMLPVEMLSVSVVVDPERETSPLVFVMVAIVAASPVSMLPVAPLSMRVSIAPLVVAIVSGCLSMLSCVVGAAPNKLSMLA